MQGPVRHILIVDDDVAIARLLRTLLVRAGYSCEVAGDGGEALRVVADKTPDVILLDLMLPRVDGFEVMDELRRKHPDALGRVVVMTAASASVLARLAPYNDAIFQLIRKPFDIGQLVDVVRECCSRESREAVTAVADDTARRRARQAAETTRRI